MTFKRLIVARLNQIALDRINLRGRGEWQQQRQRAREHSDSPHRESIKANAARPQAAKPAKFRSTKAPAKFITGLSEKDGRRNAMGRSSHLSMTGINIALSGLLVALLFFTSPNLRSLVTVGVAFWIWLACVILSGVASWHILFVISDAIGQIDGGTAFLLITPIGWLVIGFYFATSSGLVFLILYRIFGFIVISFIERHWKVELARPSTTVGLILATLSPALAWYVHSVFSV
jgi:hypothetical protein